MLTLKICAWRSRSYVFMESMIPIAVAWLLWAISHLRFWNILELRYIVTIQVVASGRTAGGQKGVPSKAKRSACRTAWSCLRAVEM
jgi:hypothetical protein